MVTQNSEPADVKDCKGLVGPVALLEETSGKPAIWTYKNASQAVKGLGFKRVTLSSQPGRFIPQPPPRKQTRELQSIISQWLTDMGSCSGTIFGNHTKPQEGHQCPLLRFKVSLVLPIAHAILARSIQYGQALTS